MHTHPLPPLILMLIVTMVGCDRDENRRLAEMAERQLERQAEQNRQNAELQQQVAEGSRHMVEADARAREELVTLHRDVQAERSEIGRQRDRMEEERRELAAQRQLNPIIAAAITNTGLLLACLLPLERVELRTCRLGSFPELAEVLKSDEPEGTSGNADDANCEVARTVPRRRSKRQVDSFGDVELAEDVHRALDPDRFTGLDDNWFWMDEFAIPIELPWFVQHAEEVYQRRQQAKLSLSKLADEFSVLRPTIKRALEHYLKEHSEARDDVNLPRGGQRPPKFDLSQFGQEARELWEKGWSKRKLAEKFGCSTPTIDKALKWAYAQDGLPLPTRKERQAATIAQARALLDDDQSLEEIARQLNVSDATARQYLKASFMTEGKPMPDLRRRDSHQ